MNSTQNYFMAKTLFKNLKFLKKIPSMINWCKQQQNLCTWLIHLIDEDNVTTYKLYYIKNFCDIAPLQLLTKLVFLLLLFLKTLPYLYTEQNLIKPVILFAKRGCWFTNKPKKNAIDVSDKSNDSTITLHGKTIFK